MVRVGTTPLRLMAIKYGADIVYSPEIIDRRLMRSQRIVNHKLGTIDYVDDQGIVNLRIHPKEKGRLVAQIGTANPEFALQAAKMIQDDVDGVDVNCGCPKKFSVQGGMGSALLETPDLLESILSTLVSSLSIPVTCKIRLLSPKDGKSSLQRTTELIQRLEKTKVEAIAIHCRFVDDRPHVPAKWDVLQSLAQAVQIPVIANGDVWSIASVRDLQRLAPSVSSFMFARGALDNVSHFNGAEARHISLILKEYVDSAVECGMDCSNVKYTLLQMWQCRDGIDFRNKLVKIKSLDDIKQFIETYEF